MFHFCFPPERRPGNCKSLGKNYKIKISQLGDIPSLTLFCCEFFFLQIVLMCALHFPSDILLTLRPTQIVTFKVK